MLRRFCQIPDDASNLLKNVASALSAKISFLMGNGKFALFMFVFTSLVLSETARFVNKERNRSMNRSLCSLFSRCILESSHLVLSPFFMCERNILYALACKYLTRWDKTTHSVATHLPNRCFLIYTRWELVSSSSSTLREELPREDHKYLIRKQAQVLAVLSQKHISCLLFTSISHVGTIKADYSLQKLCLWLLMLAAFCRICSVRSLTSG